MDLRRGRRAMRSDGNPRTDRSRNRERKETSQMPVIHPQCTEALETLCNPESWARNKTYEGIDGPVVEPILRIELQNVK